MKIRKIKPEDAEACFNNQHANHYHEAGLWSIDSWKFLSTFLTDSWVVELEGEVVAHNIGLIQQNVATEGKYTTCCVSIPLSRFLLISCSLRFAMELDSMPNMGNL